MTLSYHTLDISKMTPKQLEEKLEKGYSDIQAGCTKPAKEVFDELYKEYEFHSDIEEQLK